MLQALHAPSGALVILDRGIATEVCLQWLREHQYRYLMVSRERARRFDAEAASWIRNASSQGRHLYSVVSEDGQERRLYGFSERRAHKVCAMVDRFAQRFERA